MSRMQEERRQFWRRLIAQQEHSGVSVRGFCQQHGTSEHSFYKWRQRLAAQVPVKFALVEATGDGPAKVEAVELTLVTGERLRIAPGTDAAMLRVVLDVLREPR
jgi:transposase-like protein